MICVVDTTILIDLRLSLLAALFSSFRDAMYSGQFESEKEQIFKEQILHVFARIHASARKINFPYGEDTSQDELEELDLLATAINLPKHFELLAKLLVQIGMVERGEKITVVIDGHNIETDAIALSKLLPPDYYDVKRSWEIWTS